MNKPFQNHPIRSELPLLGVHRAVKAFKAGLRGFYREVTNA